MEVELARLDGCCDAGLERVGNFVVGNFVVGAGRRLVSTPDQLSHPLVLWCADEVFATRVAPPPPRPWHDHKRGLAFSDVLRAAQRALASDDALDSACYSEHYGS